MFWLALGLAFVLGYIAGRVVTFGQLMCMAWHNIEMATKREPPKGLQE